MVEFDLAQVKQWLLSREVRLCAPVDPAEIAKAQHIFAGQFPASLLKMYESFDGFADGDFEAESFISIWPLSKSLNFAQEQSQRDTLAFADWSFECDVAICQILDPAAPVSWIGGCKPDSGSFKDFWAMFRRGQLSG